MYIHIFWLYGLKYIFFKTRLYLSDFKYISYKKKTNKNTPKTPRGFSFFRIYGTTRLGFHCLPLMVWQLIEYGSHPG